MKKNKDFNSNFSQYDISAACCHLKSNMRTDLVWTQPDHIFSANIEPTVKKC